MKAAEVKTSATTTKKSTPFFNKEGNQSFFGQRSADNSFFSKSATQTFIQPKLTVGQPGDQYEQEADAMADQVVQRLSQPEIQQKGLDEKATPITPIAPAVQAKCAACEQEEKLQKKEEWRGEEEQLQRKPIFESNAPPPEEDIHRKCAGCEAEEKVQRKGETNVTEANNSPSLESKLTSARGSGKPLPETTRQQMESSFGADFSKVRIHTGSDAMQMNQGLHAQAFTHGSDIYFNSGTYKPESVEGKQLLAHELTHTLQQGASSKISRSISFAKPNPSPKFSGSQLSATPNLQTFNLPNFRDVVSSGADFIAETASSSIDWAGERIGEAIEMGAEAFMAIVRRVAPGLVDLIQNGPGALLSRTISQAIQSWLRGIFGEFNLGQFVDDIRTNLSNAFNLIEGVLTGDEASCQAFNNAIDAIRSFISQFMDNPFFQALRDAFNTIKDFLSEVINLLVAPIFDAVMDIAGEAFNVVREVASTVWGWARSVKNYLVEAWDWVMEQLGFTGDDSEGGIWEWLKGFASSIWEEIKTTFAPVIGPLRVVLGTLLALSPAGPVFIAVRYGPQVVEAIQWLWNNRNNPNIVQDAREEMGDTILPQLLSSGEELINQLSNTVAELLGKLMELSSGLMNLIGGLTGIPLLEMARAFVQNVSQHVQSFTTWVQESLQWAVRQIRSLFNKIRAVVEPYIEILSSIGMAILNPGMIPVILAGWAWRALPDCYKPPIINFLLDGVIAYLEALPTLPFLGSLWLLLKPFILGFLREFRSREDHEKIAITSKLAQIISGASPQFIMGFVGGFLRGVWEGLTDPFVLIHQAINGLNSLTNWFLGLFEENPEKAREQGVTPDTAQTSGEQTGPVTASASASVVESGESQQNQAALSDRMQEMGEELSPHVNEVTENFMPGLEEQFQGGEGMTLQDLQRKLGEMWESAQNAIRGAGESLAQRLVTFLMQGSAEREMGSTIGWLAGTIVFEVVLGILTAGTYTAAQPVRRALQFFARILDWTGEVLGAAFRMLSRLGGYIMTFLRRLMNIVRNAGGAMGRVLTALREIAQKIIQYGQELLGRFGRGAGGEAAEEATERAARETAKAASERAARETAEAGTERAAREGVEEASEEVAEEAAEEVAEETAERGAREGADDATKAAELPAAIAAAETITNTMDAAPYSPVPILLASLNSLKSRFRWIERFEARPKGVGMYSIHMIASDHEIDNNYTESENDAGLRTSRQANFEAEIQNRLDKGDITAEQAYVLRQYNLHNPRGSRNIDAVLDDVNNSSLEFNPKSGRFRSRGQTMSRRQEFMGSTPGKQSDVGQQVKDRMRSEGRLRTNPITGKEEVLGIIQDPDGSRYEGWFDIEDADMGHHPVDAVDFWNEGAPGFPPGRELGPRHPDVKKWMFDPDNYELQHFRYNRSLGGETTSRYLPPET